MTRKDTLELIEKLQNVNYELMDQFRSGLSWLLDYCQKNNIPYPNLDIAMSLIRTSGSFLDAYQPTGNTYNLPTRKQNLV